MGTHFYRQHTAKLSTADEMHLLELAAKGDKKAIEKIVKANQGFVVACAQKFRNSMPLDDLIQVGNEALILSFQTFDLEKFRRANCSRFITYAARRIRQAMLKAVISEDFEFSASEQIATRILTLKRAIEGKESLSMKDFAQLERETGISKKLIKKYLPFACSLANIQIGSSEAPKIVEANIKAPGKDLEDSVLEKIDAEKVLKNFGVLTELEKNVVVEYYGLGLSSPKTFKDIGKTRGHTREWPRKLFQSAIKKLRDEIERGENVLQKQEQIQQ